MPSKLVIVILYKIDLFQSPTIQSLIACENYFDEKDKIFVWDNSPTSQPEGTIKKFVTSSSCAVQYHHAADNPSLAVAYNEIINKNKEYELVIFFDQDSGFDKQYFKEIESAEAANADINLFLPLIYKGDTIVSPGHFFYFKGKYWNKPLLGKVSAKNNVAITSGMAVRMRYIKHFGKFEERLQLYGIDTNFMIRYAQHNGFFYVVSVKFDHDLSDFKEEDEQVKRMRFEQFAQSSIINSALFSLPVRALTRLFLWYRRIQDRKKYR